MFSWKRLHKNEQGQAALETAIILIAFVVVAAVFAFTILSAGNASTDKGKAAINAGMQSVESSLAVKGAVIAAGTSNKVTDVTFTVGVSGGSSPIKTDQITITYRDSKVNEAAASVEWKKLVDAKGTSDTTVLNPGDQVEVKVTLTTQVDPSTSFTLEVKPPVGAVLQISRTTPASIDTINDLG